MNKCIRCNVEKPISEFHAHPRVKYVNKHCNDCVKEMEEEFIKTHTDSNGNYFEKPYIGSGYKKKQ